MDSDRPATSYRSAARFAAMSSVVPSELLVTETFHHEDAVATSTPCLSRHDVNVHSGLMRVIFDPLIDREAISPCWLKLIA